LNPVIKREVETIDHGHSGLQWPLPCCVFQSI
jgi:hypothetical protein